MKNTWVFSKKQKNALTLCSAIFALLYATSSFAQVPSTATTTAAPGRIQEDLKARGTILPLSDKIEINDIKLQEAPAGSEDIIFEFTHVEFEGVTVYEINELDFAYANKIGTTISLADVYDISSTLTNKYRNEGYILTQVIVPPQTIDGGVVKLRVIEGFIENIHVEGMDEGKNSINLIRKYANGIEINKALNIADLERYLLIIGDLPGLNARSVLSPSETTTGAADLRIILSRDPYDAYIGVDNYGSRYLGPLEFTAAGSSNSYFGNNERISAQIVAAPDPGTHSIGDLELGYYALSYEQPLPSFGLGTNIELFASYTDTRPGYDLKDFEVEGISQYVSAKIKHPFIRSRSENLTGYALFDMREVSSRNNIQDTLHDNIRAFRAGGNYQSMDKLFGLGINSFNIELSKGVDVFGATNRNDSNITRALGNPKFTKVTGDVQRLQRVTADVNLFVEAEGQLASGPLLSSEEFGAGGASLGRGYDSSEIVGDEGVAGKVEIQWNNPYDTKIFSDYQLFGFFDVGRTWNKDATTSSNKKDIITSTGFGIRAEFSNEIKADLTFALPLNRNVQTRGDQGASILFKLSRSF
ncbi:MAG: ShlB/FhaC/HecB family hemolysin secretion/activation protein [Alphaproteobacteria bacterium]|nr:ShlB/FhaC/HecB family hemolysin secretion/activation protein [Alphaproteobacteria bacterium]